MLLGPAGSWLFSVCNFVGCLNFNLGERGFGHKHGRSALYLSKWFYDTSTGAAAGAPAVVLLLEGLRSHKVLVIKEYGGYEDLRGLGRRSVIPYVQG
jgi:hypothetical protein